MAAPIRHPTAALGTRSCYALTDLPLQWTTKVDQLKLASSPVTVTSTKATMTNKNGFTPSYNVDTWLVSHGQLVPVRSLPVGGG